MQTAASSCLLLLPMLLGLRWGWETVQVVYDRARSASWQTVEGRIEKIISSTEGGTHHFWSRSGQKLSVAIPRTTIPVDYTVNGEERTTFIPNDIFNDGGDTVDVALKPNGGSEVVVRYRDFETRVAWRLLLTVSFIGIPIWKIRGYWNSNDQVGDPNRSLPTSRKSTPSFRGSED